MAELNTTSKLILAFVTLMLGAVLIGVIATQGLLVTDKITVVDEFMDFSAKMDGGANQVNESGPNNTVTYSPEGWKVLDCPITNVVVTNSTGTVWVLNTDYLLDASQGDIAILNTTSTNVTNTNSLNSSLIDYTYCDDNYMNISWGRTAVNLVSGFFALAMLLISVGLFYSVAKDAGIA